MKKKDEYFYLICNKYGSHIFSDNEYDLGHINAEAMNVWCQGPGAMAASLPFSVSAPGGAGAELLTAS